MTRTHQPQASPVTRAGVRHAVRVTALPWRRPAVMTDRYLPLRLVPDTQSSAVISPCGRYRYRLVRRWDSALPLLCLVMLNPSKANGRRNDPTVRRCIGLARSWGYGGIVVRNLYALVSTDPDELGNHPDPVGPDNDAELALCSRQDLTVLAWGANADAARAQQVAATLWWASRERGTSLAVLGWTAGGQPRHPLYVRSGTPLECVTPAASGAHEEEDPRWGRLFFGGISAGSRARPSGCSINALRVEERALVDAHVGNLSTAGDLHGDTTKFAATCHLAIAALVSASIPSSRAASSVLRL